MNITTSSNHRLHQKQAKRKLLSRFSSDSPKPNHFVLLLRFGILVLIVIFVWIQTRIVQVRQEQQEQQQQQYSLGKPEFFHPNFQHEDKTVGEGLLAEIYQRPEFFAQNVESSASQEHQSTLSPRYVKSILCPGCRHTTVSNSKTCGSILDNAMAKNKTLDLAEAIEKVNKFHKTCEEACTCSSGGGGGNSSSTLTTKKNKFWFFDGIFPTTVQNATHYLTSIPMEARMPNNAQVLATSFNVTQFMADKWSDGKRIDVFFEYNPTLAALPEPMQQRLARHFSKQDEPVYVASFRVSSDHSCYSWNEARQYFDRRQVELSKFQNHLGLALLRADLSQVPNADIVIDLEKELGFRTNSYFVDYRLFTFNDRLYVNINGPPVYLAPLDLRIPEKVDDPPLSPTEKSKLTGQYLFENPGEPIVLQNKFGSSSLRLQAILGTTPTTIFGVVKGKNYALFQPPALQAKNEVVAEFSIHMPRVVQHFKPDEVNYLSKCQLVSRFYGKEKKKCAPFANATAMFADPAQKIKPQSRWSCIFRREAMPTSGHVVSSQVMPPPTFATIDELWFSNAVFNRFAHGGACCAPIASPNNGGGGKLLFVGIGHTKVPFRSWMSKPQKEQQTLDQPHHQYASFLYAFEPHPPYTIVARSGLFCLPFASEAETKINAYQYLASRKRLTFKRHLFNCAKISFPSGIVQHATDDDKIIVSYGINDCTPRMVVLEKRGISKLLFG